MKISKRLDFIINEIENDNIIDIGTDHAYVPIAAILRGKIKNAIASDIRYGPLDIAKKNVSDFGFQDHIQLILSNGLENIDVGKFNGKVTGIIAGMGGLIICDIIENGKDKLQSISQLILQPQNNFYYVRKKLHSLGFMIANEIFFYQKKFYNIINARHGQDFFYDEKDYAAGKILLAQKNLLLKKFLCAQLEKLSPIINFSAEALMFYNLYLEALKCFARR